jgi:hypothetical protein
MARIIVETHCASPWRVGGLSIDLDGKTIGKVAPNSRSDFLIGAGSHVLSVKAGSGKSQPVPFRIAEQENLTFSCSVVGVIRSEVTLTALFRRQSDNRFTHNGAVNYGRRFGDVMPWNAVLGVSERATMEEIRAAYLKAIQKVHPDLTANMTELERQIAYQEAQVLNSAYAAAKRKRGAGGEPS